jgi:hypothetical protein
MYGKNWASRTEHKHDLPVTLEEPWTLGNTVPTIQDRVSQGPAFKIVFPRVQSTVSQGPEP